MIYFLQLALILASEPADGVELEAACGAHIQSVIGSFDEFEAVNGVHPLDMPQRDFMKSMEDALNSPEKEIRDTVWNMILALGAANEAGCGTLRKEIQKLRR